MDFHCAWRDVELVSNDLIVSAGDQVLERLLDEIQSDGLHRSHGLWNIAMPCYDDHRKTDVLSSMTPDVRAAIASMEVDEIFCDGVVIGQTKKLKFWDKNAALETAMRHLGLFGQVNSQRSPNLKLQILLVGK